MTELIGLNLVSKDVDEAFEEFSKIIPEISVFEGVSFEDIKKDFYLSHNYARNELRKLGWKHGDEIPTHEIPWNLFWYDYHKAFKNIPLNTCFEYITKYTAKKKNIPADEVTVKDLGWGTRVEIGLMLALRYSIPLHVVMSYLPEEDTI